MGNISFLDFLLSDQRQEILFALSNLIPSVVNAALGTLACPTNYDPCLVRNKLWYILMIIGSIILIVSSLTYIILQSATLKILIISSFLLLLFAIFLRSQDTELTSND